MRKILHEIHQQPLHVRKVFAWTLIIISFLIVGAVWLKSTTSNIAEMLDINKKEAVAKKPDKKEESPFSAIGKSIGDLKANISELWSNRSEFDLEKFQQNAEEEPIPTQKLP